MIEEIKTELKRLGEMSLDELIKELHADDKPTRALDIDHKKEALEMQRIIDGDYEIAGVYLTEAPKWNPTNVQRAAVKKNKESLPWFDAREIEK